LLIVDKGKMPPERVFRPCLRQEGHVFKGAKDHQTGCDPKRFKNPTMDRIKLNDETWFLHAHDKRPNGCLLLRF
jgi:hypothetical protein